MLFVYKVPLRCFNVHSFLAHSFPAPVENDLQYKYTLNPAISHLLGLITMNTNPIHPALDSHKGLPPSAGHKH